MAIWRRGLAAGLFVFLVMPVLAEEPQPKKDRPKSSGDVILFVDQLTDALKLLPRAVLLSPERHAEQLAELERLRKQAKTDVPMLPSECSIKGKVESGRVTLTVDFTLVPERAGSVRLACGKKAHLLRCLLDGKPAPVRVEPDGLHVQVATTEVVHLVLELAVPIQPGDNSRSFELELPRAASTHLKELELPSGLKDLRLSDVPLAETLLTLKNERLSGSLGAADRLQLSWREPKTVMGPMLLVAESAIEVSVDEKQQLTTTAILQLQVKSGQTSSWRLLVPPGAEVKVPAEIEARLEGIDVAEPSPYASLRTIRFKDPIGEPVTVTVRVPAKALPKGGRVPVGPFAVLGAVRQSGTILVRSTARDLQYRLTPTAEVTPRSPSADEQKLAPFVSAYKFERTTVPEKVKTATGVGSYSLLDLEAESVRGLIETRVSHVLRLPRRGADLEMPRSWEVVTTVKARLVQPGVEMLEFQLPPAAQYIANQTTPTRPIQELKLDGPRNVLQFRLDRDNWKEFATSFKVRYDAPVEFPGEMVLPLPRPLDTDRAGDLSPIEAIVPEDVELILPEKPNPTLELVRQSTQEQVWQTDPTADRPQEQVVLAVRPYRPDVQATSTIDLTLTPREGRIRHEIRLRQSRLAPRTLTLKVPVGLTGPLRVIQGGKLVRPEGVIQLDGPMDQEPVVVLEYAVTLAEETHPNRGRAPFAVPLVVPEQATTGETRLRIWSEQGLLPLIDGKDRPWSEQPLEEVPGIKRLPVLVLRAGGLETSLPLRFAEVQGKLVPVIVRRALIRLLIQENLTQTVSASYLLQQVNGRAIEIDLPAAVPALSGLQFRIDGNVVDTETIDEAGERNENGRSVRLRLPIETTTRPSLLDVTYTLLQPRSPSPFATTIQPPILRGDPGRMLTRWAIVLPASAVAIAPEEGPGSRRIWVRRGAMIASRPAESLAELEVWLAGGDASPREPESAFASPALVCWRHGIQPLTVYQVPQQIWLLACSLVLLAVGLVLIYWWRRILREEGSPAGLLVLCVALVLVPLVASLWFPTLLAAIALGIEPGVVVLLVVGLFQWWAHERERRRMVFLPSFSRKRSPSTIQRPQNPVQPRTEPSTVDASPES